MFFYFLLSNVILTESFKCRSNFRNVRPLSHVCYLSSQENDYEIENRIGQIDNLRAASFDRSIDPEVINTAIEQLESSKLDVKCSDLRNKWELIYSTIIPGGYFPVTEICDFYGYTINSSWGFLSLGGFTGKSVILSESNPAVIQFSSDIYRLGGLEFKLNNAKPRSYTFLYADECIAVARSSSGVISVAIYYLCSYFTLLMPY
jgi:hypothetical protein